ncbi:hypothetical protein WDW86_07955 [Bdellovibrionota bacterium FG-2]
MGGLQQTLHDISNFEPEKTQFLRKTLALDTFDTPNSLPSAPSFVKEASVWYQLFELARKNSSQIFLYEMLNRVEWQSALPQKTRLRLAELHAREKILASIGEEDLRVTCRGLCKTKIPFTLLNSTQIWREIYPSFMPCPTHPNQLLIRTNEFPKALSVLGKLGFRSSENVSTHAQSVSLYRPHSPQGVTLKHALTGSPFLLEDEEYESHTREVHIPGLEGLEKQTLALTPVFLFLNLLSEALTQRAPIQPTQILDLTFAASSCNEGSALPNGEKFLDYLKKTRTLSMAWFMLGISKNNVPQLEPTRVLNLLEKNISPLKKKIINQQIKHFAWLNTNPTSLGERIKKSVEQQWLKDW